MLGHLLLALTLSIAVLSQLIQSEPIGNLEHRFSLHREQQTQLALNKAGGLFGWTTNITIGQESEYKCKFFNESEPTLLESLTAQKLLPTTGLFSLEFRDDGGRLVFDDVDFPRLYLASRQWYGISRWMDH